MNALMMAAVIFLGLQLLQGGMGGNQPETRSYQQIVDNMRDLNRGVKDITIQAEYAKFDRKLEQEAKDKGWSEQKKNEEKVKAIVLTAHTSLVGGVRLNETGRVNTAYTKLDTNYTWISKQDSLWKMPVEVTPHPSLPQSTFTPEELYSKSRDELSRLYRKEPVIGFIPGYDLIDKLVALTGYVPSFSYWFAGLLLAIVVRAIVFPLAHKQLIASRRMMLLTPLMNELKKKHTDKAGKTDNIAYQTDVMNLYKEYGINPFRGCGPAFAQIPFFLIVFQCMMHYRFEFTKGTFLWINPASHAANPFFSPDLGKMDTLLLIVYGVTMVITTYLQPVTDPMQAKQQRMMGMIFAVIATVMMFFYPLPSAFVVYWIFLNILSTAQSLVTYRLPIPPLEKVQTPAGGVRPRSGFFDKLLDQQQEALKLQAELERKKQEDERKSKQDEERKKRKKGEEPDASGA